MPQDTDSHSNFDPEEWREQAWIAVTAGMSAYRWAKLHNMPTGTVSAYISSRRSKDQAKQLGQAEGAQTQEAKQTEKVGIGAKRPLSIEEKMRASALKLLNAVRRGDEGISKERITAAVAIASKIKPSSDTDEDNATVYASMGDEELAEHVLTSCCASIGIQRVRETLDRLERERVLVQSPGEAAQALGISNAV